MSESSKIEWRIVVEVSFREWTPRGELRQTKFLAVRHDKIGVRRQHGGGSEEFIHRIQDGYRPRKRHSHSSPHHWLAVW
ncbi:hypothetical protein AB4Y32_22205 [Paraburkholderia phymatum]|uniref:Uncharacterized protein n=1 Tax=Paraburkholderia phymatum TaxID=148447 RepID=A0ACC6U4G7_9BURK